MAAGRVILPVWLGFLIIGNYGSQIMAQQVYSQDYSEDCDNFHKESSGYLCNGAAKECPTFALYRAQQFYMSLDDIGSLFNTNPATIASASNLPLTNYSKSLDKDQAVLFPIDCKCAGKFSQANLTYTVKADDIYLKIANQTLEGLTTCQAMREQNPKVGENDLVPGMKLVAPLRCACPTRQQLNLGVKYLLSYIADVEDDDDIITAKFNIRHQDFISANGLEESNPTIYPYTTLLIPLNDTPTIPPTGPFAPPPPPTFTPSPPLVLHAPPSSRSHNRLLVILISAAAALLIVVGALITLAVCFMKRRRREIVQTTEAKKVEAVETPQDSNPIFSELSDLLRSDRLIRYTMKELHETTDNFSAACRIEGSVFSGFLRGKKVAIKQMKGEVSKEINLLHKIHHANLVTLLGICLSHEEQHVYLVFEYVENESLSNWIEGAGARHGLSWKQRIQIAVDIAEGLEYLHHGINPPCVHKDLRTSNILLDRKFRAKIANFGMAKSGAGVAALTSHIIGTHGYMAPEYLRDGLVTPKLDVFAFGVIVLQMLSGRMAVENRRPGYGERLLSDEIRDLLQGENAKEKLSDWMDPNLQELHDLGVAFRVACVAKSCVEKDLALRPSMTEIRVELSSLTGFSAATMSSELEPR